MTHNPVTLVTLSYMILSHAPSLYSKSRKEEKGKEKKNNDLVVLPSHDKSIINKNFTITNSSESI